MTSTDKEKQLKSRWEVICASDPWVLRHPLGQFNVRGVEVTFNGVARTLVAVACEPLVDGALIRINSACLTSETFGAENCDCSWQLWAAMKIIRSCGGAIIYCPHHEGRGAGLFAKLQSFALMDQYGVSNAEAFRRLGLPLDQRTYGEVAAVIRWWKLRRVRLLTNNPNKRLGLEEQGIIIDGIEPLAAMHREQWREYLLSKVADLGHIIDSVAKGSING